MLITLWRISPVLLLLGALLLHRATSEPRRAPHVAFGHDGPNVVSARYDDPRVVAEEQLLRVLGRMRPARQPARTNVWLHALRLWGPKAEFGDSKYVDGGEILDYLLDDETFRRVQGEETAPLVDMVDGQVVIRPWRSWEENSAAASAHTDDVLATFGEIELPLSTKLNTRHGVTTIGHALTSSLGRFHRTQTEYEWSAISFARYLFPSREWTNQYGHRITIDELVDEVIEAPLRDGVCAGTHRLEALVVLYRADETAHVLPTRTRRRILEHLAKVSGLLMRNQAPDGSWPRDWANDSGLTDVNGDLPGRILATGHHLEWLALAPENVHPPRENIIRAAQWLVRAMDEVDEPTLNEQYGPFSHAARALCLWRSRDPYEVWQQGNVDTVSRL